MFLRTVRAEAIEGVDGDELATNLNAFFAAGEEKTFIAAFHVAAFVIVVLYAE